MRIVTIASLLLLAVTVEGQKTEKILSVKWSKKFVTVEKQNKETSYRLYGKDSLLITEITNETVVIKENEIATNTTVKAELIQQPPPSRNFLPVFPRFSMIPILIPIDIESKPISGLNSPSITYTKTTKDFYNKKARLSEFMHYYGLKYGLKPTLYLSINYTPLASYRLVTVQDPAFTGYDKVDERSSKESTSYGQNFSVAAGVHFGIAFALYGEYIRTRQGFISEGSAVDWSTGLPVSYSGDNRYRFTANAYGIGITVTAQTRAVRMAGDAGIYYVSMNKYKDGQVTVSGADLASNPLTAPIRRNSVMAKFGIGPSIRLGPTLNLRLIPTVYYQLGSINKKILKTRLYSFGLQCGLSFAGKRGMKASNPPNNNNK